MVKLPKERLSDKRVEFAREGNLNGFLTFKCILSTKPYLLHYLMQTLITLGWCSCFAAL